MAFLLSQKKKLLSLRIFVRPIKDFWKKAGNWLRQKATYPFRVLPFDSERFGPPKGFHLTPQIYCQEEGEGEYIEVFSPEALRRQSAQGLPSTPHWILEEQLQQTSPAAYLVRIPEGRFWTWHNGRNEVGAMAFISKQDHVIGGISYGFGYLEKVQRSKVFGQVKLGDALFVPGKVVVLTSIMAEQFYHWMIDILPKFQILLKANIDWDTVDALVINDLNRPYIQASLDMLNLPIPRIISSQQFPYIKAKEIIAVSPPAYVGSPRGWMVGYLRNTFLPHIPQQLLPQRIFVSRAGAKKRRLENEDKVMELLETYGFVRVVLEKLPFLEQMAYFQQARVIVGPHGAGFTHLAFAQPGAKLIEFFNPQYINVCYYNLSNLAGVAYYYLEGEGFRPPNGINLSIGNADIRLDLRKLEQILALAGVDRI